MDKNYVLATLKIFNTIGVAWIPFYHSAGARWFLGCF